LTQEEIFWDCIPVKKDEPFQIFLATDNEETRQTAIEKFPKNNVIFFNESISRSTKSGIIAGIIEIFLLAQCDEIMVSAASTFSRVSYSLANKFPISINRRNECKKRSFSQPCFFKWNYTRPICFDERKFSSLSSYWKDLVQEDCDFV